MKVAINNRPGEANASVVALSGDRAIVGDEESMSSTLFVRQFDGTWYLPITNYKHTKTYGNQVSQYRNISLVGCYGGNYTFLISHTTGTLQNQSKCKIIIPS